MDTRAPASFSGDKEYRVNIKLRVKELDENADPSSMDEESEERGRLETPGGSTDNLIAIEVVQALCECPAGISGGCAHTAMLLFLARMLRMSDAELATFNPSTCTGRACVWLQKHCNGGRSASKCPWYGMPLSEGAAELRKMRDPRGQMDVEDEPVHTRGVVPIDRTHDFNPHPFGGEWAERDLHFTAGVDISRFKLAKLMEFVDGERNSPEQKVCMDYLPPLVREDDTP